MVAYQRHLRPWMECPRCTEKYPSFKMDPHHPWGRQRMLTDEDLAQCSKIKPPYGFFNLDVGEKKWDSLYQFIFLCRHCHTFIHDNPKLGEEQGWIIP